MYLERSLGLLVAVKYEVSLGFLVCGDEYCLLFPNRVNAVTEH
jgi:hypothetical protein